MAALDRTAQADVVARLWRSGKMKLWAARTNSSRLLTKPLDSYHSAAREREVSVAMCEPSARKLGKRVVDTVRAPSQFEG
jgi:hypothetical protein